MPDTKTFEPLPWQLAPWKDTHPILLLSGGAGSGKSVLAAHKLNAFCLKFPGALGLAVRKSRAFLHNSVLPLLQSAMPSSVKHRSTVSRFDYPNESRIVYGGLNDDKQRESIRSIMGKNGSGADIIWIEEANRLTDRDFDELMGRLRGTAAPWTQLILSCNPDSDRHWINQRLRMPWLAGKSRDRVAVYETKPTDNPFLSQAYLETLQHLSGLMRARLWLSQWCRADGVIYDSFDPAVHICDPFEIPEHWRRFVSIDMGFTNPRVALWGAVDYDDNLVIYRQTYQTKQTATEHAAQLLHLSKNERIGPLVCDHDAAERQDYRQAGLDSFAAFKDVALGLQAVATRLMNTVNGTGPTLRIFRDSLAHEPDEELIETHKPWCLEHEFDGYVWETSTDGSKLKENPKKENDHGLDALRYLVMMLDKDQITDPAGDPEAIRQAMAQARRELGGPRGGVLSQSGMQSVRPSRWA